MIVRRSELDAQVKRLLLVAACSLEIDVGANVNLLSDISANQPRSELSKTYTTLLALLQFVACCIEKCHG